MTDHVTPEEARWESIRKTHGADVGYTEAAQDACDLCFVLTRYDSLASQVEELQRRNRKLKGQRNSARTRLAEAEAQVEELTDSLFWARERMAKHHKQVEQMRPVVEAADKAADYLQWLVDEFGADEAPYHAKALREALAALDSKASEAAPDKRNVQSVPTGHTTTERGYLRSEP